MSQILHIFKKDARHLWPEIMNSFGLTVAFACTTILQWSDPGSDNIHYMQLAASFLAILVPVSWWVLIVRLTHDEALVGDNQFWITRPYQWQKLLAAKALFLLLFLYLPVLLAQMVILAGAGFQPFARLPELVSNLVWITGFLVLPFLALAAVTSLFVTFILMLLGSVVYSVLLFGIASLIPGASFPNPWANPFQFGLILGICALVVVLQYATRNLQRSRVFLLALPPAAIFCFFAWPTSGLAHHLYPSISANAHPPIQLAFDPDSSRQSSNLSPGRKNGDTLYLPLAISGIPSDTILRAQALRVSIEAQNGLHWDSHWQGTTDTYSPASPRSFVILRINHKFLSRIQSTRVRVTVTLGLTQLRAGNASVVRTGEQDFSIPEGGICSVDNFFGVFPVCRFPMRQPRLTSLVAHWSDGPCSRKSPSNSAGAQGQAWIGRDEGSSVDFGLVPVKLVPVRFSNQNISQRSSFICPGTPITVTPYSVVGRFQTTLTTPDLNLTDYTTGSEAGKTH